MQNPLYWTHVWTYIRETASKSKIYKWELVKRITCTFELILMFERLFPSKWLANICWREEANQWTNRNILEIPFSACWNSFCALVNWINVSKMIAFDSIMSHHIPLFYYLILLIYHILTIDQTPSWLSMKNTETCFFSPFKFIFQTIWTRKIKDSRSSFVFCFF